MWPYEPRFHALSEGRLHYVDVGEGSPTLFSHGTPTWSIDWRHAIAALPGRRIAVDHLGFGRSDRPAVGYRPEDHARRFAAFASALDLRDVTLVVHDFGGPIALPWALDNADRLRRLVVLNTFAWPLGDDWRVRLPGLVLGSWVGRLLYAWANLSLRVIMPTAYADRAKLTPELHAALLAPFAERSARVQVLWPLARALLASSGFYAGIEARLPELAGVPVTLVWGMRDPAFPPHHLERWKRHFPNAEVVETDAGHWPQEERPEALVRTLRSADAGDPSDGRRLAGGPRAAAGGAG